MTTHEQIYNILKNPDKEKIKIEFKTTPLLRSNDGQSKLGCEIVAFANRHGGKLLIGINDDGSFEGKNIFDIDKDKGIIDEICHTKISPSIEYFIEYLEFNEGDILIIDIPKRKGIPHAFIVSRKGPEIKNRIYYIRTEHGKRLASDSQLEWLFKNREDPNFSFPFSFNINYISKNFGMLPQIPQPHCLWNFYPFINLIPNEEITKFHNNNENVRAFFIEICPYALLSSFAWVFSNSWLMNVKRRKGKTTWIPNRQLEKIQKITVNEIPKPGKDSILSQLSWDFSLVLNNTIHQSICMPEGTKIKIFSENNGFSSKLILSNNEFNFEINFQFSFWSVGFHSAHPYAGLFSNNSTVEANDFQGGIQNLDLDGKFEARFEYPEQNIDFFNEYYQLANSIQDILQNEWDFDTFSNGLPAQEIYSIDAKLTNIQIGLNNLIERKK